MFHNGTAADTYIIAPFIVPSFLSTSDQVHTGNDNILTGLRLVIYAFAALVG